MKVRNDATSSLPMSATDPDHEDDAYASDEYEQESPTRSQPSPARYQQQQRPIQFDDDAMDDDESGAAAVTPLPKAKSKRRQTSQESDRISGRHLMDNTPWTYTVSALQVRMLRIPVAGSAAIRELRVFATIDKHATQSGGSRWKQELQPVGGGSPLRSTRTRRSRRLRSPARGGRMEPYRRSGLIEEAKWVRGEGKLHWTFPMENFRRLKAYAPRIKAFVYGIGEGYRSRSQPQNLARQEKDGEILSFGWFFLDIRTPDLPERWLKLQNSPYGGEILISSAFSPVELSHAQSSEGRTPASTRARITTLASNNVVTVPTVVAGENGDYLQIGDNKGQDIFVISVFIQTALNLSKVAKTTMGEYEEELQRTGFWLSYSLFDVVVQTDVFYNLDVAEFPPIRDSFRVKSSLKDLELYIEALGGLTVFMCTENRVLTGVEISLLPLLSKALFSGSIKSRPGDTCDIEGNFTFPDFDDAVMSASVAVEFVESKKTQADHTGRFKQIATINHAIDVEGVRGDTTESDTKIDTSPVINERPAQELILLKLDHMWLKTSELVAFTGEESISIEVTIGEERVSGELNFCSFTKHHAFATSPAIGVVLGNISSQNELDAPIRIRCVSSESDHLIATSTEESKVIRDDGGYPKAIVFQMLNDSMHSVGQCTLGCARGSNDRQQLGRKLLSDASGDKHRYRLCLKLKSVRDVEAPGGYSLRYQNPFLRSSLITSEWFIVQNKSEVDTLGFYCIFDLAKDPLEFKQEMQESVNIDLISSDDERMGSAIFSLSYLFFSEEHFCCSVDNCEEIFMTQTDAEAHWLEVHTESTLPDTQAGPEAYSHSYRSCSISIPVVNADDKSGSTNQQSQRMGSIRVSAYLEDIGLLTDQRAAAQEAVLSLPPPPKESSSEEPSASPRRVNTAPVQEARERSDSASVIREAEEPNRYTSATKGSSMVDISTDSPHPGTEDIRADRAREREMEAAQLKETLERERSAWRQEQHLQQLQWKRRFAEMEKARMDEMEEEWARREEERSNLLKSAQDEYQRLEQTLRKSLADLETRERRLAVSEAALQREKEAKRDENESLQRRLKSEQSHTLSLAKKQTEAYERRVALLETQLSDAEKRVKQVEADFVEYRQQQRKLPESKLREEIAALKGNVAELEKQKMAKERECEISEADVDKMKAQLEQMANLLTQEKKKHEARAVDELEKLRVKYIAREEKYVLDGDRDELRAIKKQLDDLKRFKLRGNGEKLLSPRHHHSRQSASPQHRHNNWHTQSRQTAFVQHARSASQNDRHPPTSRDEGSWRVLSFIETSRPSPTPQFKLHLSRSEQGVSSPRSRTNRQSSPTRRRSCSVCSFQHLDNEENESASLRNSYEGTELGRLIRERKLLLASGAYDAQSHLVRELDRLINVTKVNTASS